MAAASTFSYAQAAKGQSTSPPTSGPNPASQPQGTPPASAPEHPVDSSQGSHVVETRPHAVGEKQDVVSNVGSESDLRSEVAHERRSEIKRDDESGRTDRPWRRTEKGTRSSSTTTRSVDDQERKPRKSKKSKGSSDKQSNDQAAASDKVKEIALEVPKVELSEAPIPSVNIWHQRKEQQAKVKPSSLEDMSNGTSAHEADAKKPTKDPAPISPAKENIPTNGVKPSRKAAGESGRPERNGSRGSRLADKDGKAVLPPSVDDAALWPTPEITTKEEQKKPAAAKSAVAPEKEAQDDGSQGKRTKEKWVTYEYVPSVNFETQLPQMRNSKPRGGARSANASRAAPSAPAQQSSEKPTTGAGTNNAIKPSESKERAKESNANSSKTTDLPPAPKRTSMDVNNAAREQKRTPFQTGSDKSKDTVATHPSVSDPVPIFLPFATCSYGLI
ncbi:hypothetical protein UVI_02037170 [Ustilaginoidea virens]|uniref:La domain family n=1 Tax=Ustilaginoidea virens TaxID=1159556 RepID=A0A1B5L441_USTVR|nr:hypothetical protein UVI_02037170 [Ustilaginoidea virens]